nr:hypothetical protein CFP56_76447 [Quercus suber]
MASLCPILPIRSTDPNPALYSTSITFCFCFISLSSHLLVCLPAFCLFTTLPYLLDAAGIVGQPTRSGFVLTLARGGRIPETRPTSRSPITNLLSSITTVPLRWYDCDYRNNVGDRQRKSVGASGSSQVAVHATTCTTASAGKRTRSCGTVIDYFQPQNLGLFMNGL